MRDFCVAQPQISGVRVSWLSLVWVANDFKALSVHGSWGGCCTQAWMTFVLSSESSRKGFFFDTQV
jgi:hypothetical protein